MLMSSVSKNIKYCNWGGRYEFTEQYQYNDSFQLIDFGPFEHADVTLMRNLGIEADLCF